MAYDNHPVSVPCYNGTILILDYLNKTSLSSRCVYPTTPVYTLNKLMEDRYRKNPVYPNHAVFCGFRALDRFKGKIWRAKSWMYWIICVCAAYKRMDSSHSTSGNRKLGREKRGRKQLRPRSAFQNPNKGIFRPATDTSKRRRQSGKNPEPR